MLGALREKTRYWPIGSAFRNLNLYPEAHMIWLKDRMLADVRQRHFQRPLGTALRKMYSLYLLYINCSHFGFEVPWACTTESGHHLCYPCCPSRGPIRPTNATIRTPMPARGCPDGAAMHTLEIPLPECWTLHLSVDVEASFYIRYHLG